MIDDSDEELERLDRLEEERVRLSKTLLADEADDKAPQEEDVKMVL